MVEKVREYGAIVLAESLGPKLTKYEAVFKESYKMLSNSDPPGIIGVLQGMAERPDRRELLSKITVPALVVAGDKDQIIDLGDARQMAGALSKAKFHLILGAGHMPMLEKPEDMALGLDWLISEMEMV
jgi:pimeloyl-ACP methyl ester carboxylesterase